MGRGVKSWPADSLSRIFLSNALWRCGMRACKARQSRLSGFGRTRAQRCHRRGVAHARRRSGPVRKGVFVCLIALHTKGVCRRVRISVEKRGDDDDEMFQPYLLSVCDTHACVLACLCVCVSHTCVTRICVKCIVSAFQLVCAEGVCLLLSRCPCVKACINASLHVLVRILARIPASEHGPVCIGAPFLAHHFSGRLTTISFFLPPARLTATVSADRTFDYYFPLALPPVSRPSALPVSLPSSSSPSLPHLPSTVSLLSSPCLISALQMTT
eukprot:6194854-Pleurochrysis_carterae.AAC.1